MTPNDNQVALPDDVIRALRELAGWPSPSAENGAYAVGLRPEHATAILALLNAPQPSGGEAVAWQSMDSAPIAVAALQNGAAALRSARVPEPCEYPQPDPETGADRGACCAHAYADGWNDCRRKMLAAAPSAEGVE